MSWQDAMMSDITRLLHSRTKRTESVSELEFDADVYGPYGCETCGPEYSLDSKILFLSDSGRVLYTFRGDWGDLMTAINELDD